MLLAAGGAVLALNSAGRIESQGLVGLVGGVLVERLTNHPTRSHLEDLHPEVLMLCLLRAWCSRVDR
jgi:hypothetical protein